MTTRALSLLRTQSSAVLRSSPPEHRGTHAPRWIISSAACAILFIADLFCVESGLTKAPDRSLDLEIHAAFGRSSYGFFEFVSTMGGGAGFLIVIGVVALSLVITQFWWGAALAVVGVGGASVLESLIKPIVGRSRPHLFPHAVQAGGSSFPSGHATDAGAFALVTIVLVSHFVQRRRLAIATSALLLTFAGLVGLSRVVLGVHFPTDVLGGWALAGAWVGLVAALFNRSPVF